MVEHKTSKHPHNAICFLIPTISTLMINMKKEHLIQACNNFWTWIEDVIVTNILEILLNDFIDFNVV